MFGHVARDVLLAIKGQFRCKLDQCVRDTVSRLSLRRRGCRAGEHCRRRRLAAETSSACRNHGEIPTIMGNRCQSAITGQLFHGHRDVRVSALQRVQRCSPQSLIRVGLLNARSVSNKRGTSITLPLWIHDADNKLHSEHLQWGCKLNADEKNYRLSNEGAIYTRKCAKYAQSCY